MENLTTPQPNIPNKPSDVTTQDFALSQLGQQLKFPLDYVTIELLKQAIGATQAFPIGSIYIAVVATNPSSLLGYGTWTAFATGRTLVGIDIGDASFDVVEETGGSKTHTLTVGEIPSHTHGANNGGNSNGAWASTAGNSYGSVSDATGGGGAHNNLQPYIVTYMWKRTA